MAESRGDAKGFSTEKLSDFVFNAITFTNTKDILKKALDERKSNFVWLVRPSSQEGMIAVDYTGLDKESKPLEEPGSLRFAFTNAGWKCLEEDEEVKNIIKITKENIEEHIGKLFIYLETIKEVEEVPDFSFSVANRVSPSVENDCYSREPFCIGKIERTKPSQICALSDSLIAVIWQQKSESAIPKSSICVYDTAKKKNIPSITGSPQAITLNHDGSHLLVMDPFGLYQLSIKTFFLEEPKNEDYAKLKYLAKWESLTPYDIVCNSEGCIFISFTNGLVQQLKPNTSKLENIVQMESSPRLHINKNNQLVCVGMETNTLVKKTSGPHRYTTKEPIDQYYSICEVGKKPIILPWERAPSLTRSKFFTPNKFAAIDGINENTIKILDLDSKVSTQLSLEDKSSLQLTTNAAEHLVTMSAKGLIKVWDMSRASDQCINEFKVNVNTRDSNFAFYVNPFTGTLFYENYLGRLQELILDFNLREEEVRKCFGSKEGVEQNDICINIPHIHPGVVSIMLDFLRHKPSEDARIMPSKQQPGSKV